MPADGMPGQQVNTAKHQGQCTGLTEAARLPTKKGIKIAVIVVAQCLDGSHPTAPFGFHVPQRAGHGDGIQPLADGLRSQPEEVPALAEIVEIERRNCGKHRRMHGDQP